MIGYAVERSGDLLDCLSDPVYCISGGHVLDYGQPMMSGKDKVCTHGGLTVHCQVVCKTFSQLPKSQSLSFSWQCWGPVCLSRVSCSNACLQAAAAPTLAKQLICTRHGMFICLTVLHLIADADDEGHDGLGRHTGHGAA